MPISPEKRRNTLVAGTTAAALGAFMVGSIVQSERTHPEQQPTSKSIPHESASHVAASIQVQPSPIQLARRISHAASRSRVYPSHSAKPVTINVISGTYQPPSPTDLARLRECESGGNPATNTGNGFYGAYQFDLETYHGLGYSGLPSDASLATQTEAAIRLEEERGWQPWPACSQKLGLVAIRN